MVSSVIGVLILVIGCQLVQFLSLSRAFLDPYSLENGFYYMVNGSKPDYMSDDVAYQ